MIFKTISKSNFEDLIRGIIADNVTIGPVVKAHDNKGNPVYQFDEITSYEMLKLDYTKSYSSLKNFFLPYKETMSTYRFDQESWQQEIGYTIHPRVIVGVRACDIDALLKLDNVLMKGKFASPYYVARRKNTFLIGLDHEPFEDCFCRSLNSDVVSHGFDIFMTDIGDRYFLQINSSKALNLLKNVATDEVREQDQDAYKRERRRISKLFESQVDVTGLSSLMDIEFDDPVWQKWGDKCLSCGNCAMVCPTCYCYSVSEDIDISLQTASKNRFLYSCNLVDFAEVAGGHNFRPKAQSRLKYRFYHQHRGFVESYDEPKCVGCNRCGRACPADISPVDVINDLRKEHL